VGDSPLAAAHFVGSMAFQTWPGAPLRLRPRLYSDARFAGL